MAYLQKGDTVALGCDHGGFALAEEITAHLRESDITVCRFGCANGEPVDYPEVAEAVCRAIQDGRAKCGILICGTGIGMSIAANKLTGIRAAVCAETYSAKYTRLHNDANVLCLGGRVLGAGAATEITDTFLRTDFEGGRHRRRVDAIGELENRR